MNRTEYEEFISRSSEEALQFSKGKDDTGFTPGWREIWSSVLCTKDVFGQEQGFSRCLNKCPRNNMTRKEPLPSGYQICVFPCSSFNWLEVNTGKNQGGMKNGLSSYGKTFLGDASIGDGQPPLSLPVSLIP